LGYSHPVVFEEKDGITFEVGATQSGAPTIAVKGSDKQRVGEVAAKIRGKRPPEPYLGKGIKYADERIRRKAGKTGK
jgi:large subunit ribosomal protein L6